MATLIKMPIKKTKSQLKKELERFSLPDRDPDMATEELFGIWKGSDISIEKIREKNNHNKWLLLMLML